ncbi:hypothetical protein F5Y16DRAFT_360132 [Xylariaceae sp. FL0255]|nr:hypothetical protein F5Y16DRAFT_360132 [Xylariaceae sp. FL0255]
MEESDVGVSEYETAASGSPPPSCSSSEDPIEDRTSATFALAPNALSDGTADALTKNTTQSWQHGRGIAICPECGKQYKRMDTMKRHRKTSHHVGLQYYCTEPPCSNRSYGRFDHYRKHMRVAHSKLVEARHPKKYRLSNGQLRIPQSSPTVHSQLSQANSSAITSVSTQEVSTTSLASSHRSPSLSIDVKVNGSSSTPGLVTHTLSNLESRDRGELLQLLGAKIHECEELRRQCEIARMERDEYLDALKMSEESRARLEAKMR